MKLISKYSKGVDDAANKLLNDDDEFQSVHDDSTDTDNVDLQMQMIDLVNCSQARLEIFTGDPLRFNEFMALFDEMFHKKTFSDQIKLTRLFQYTSSVAKSAIRHTALMGGSRGYDQARKILKSRFGDPYIIANQTIENLKSGKAVSSPSEFQALADDLCAAKETLGELKMYSEIDNQLSIGQILNRYPRFVRQKWDRKALKEKRATGKYPVFKDFVVFTSDFASDMCDPLYGHESSRVVRPGSNSNMSKGTCNTAFASENTSRVYINRTSVKRISCNRPYKDMVYYRICALW